MSSGIDSNSKYNYLQRVQSFRGLYSQRGGCCRGPKTAFTEGGCMSQRPCRGPDSCIYRGEGVAEALQRPYSGPTVALQWPYRLYSQRGRCRRGPRTVFAEEGLCREEELALQRPCRLYSQRGGYCRAVTAEG